MPGTGMLTATVAAVAILLPATLAIFFLICSLLHMSQVVEGVGQGGLKGEWCYWEDERCAPDTWTGTCATGRKQSPIDLNSKLADYGGVFFHWPSQPLCHLYGNQHLVFPSFLIENTGHSVQITLPPARCPILSDPFRHNNGKPYTFQQLHFHWGLGIAQNGSEHTINGKAYAGEMHFVHYASEYGSFQSALDAKADKESILVVAVLLKLSHAPNEELIPIIDAIPQIFKYESGWLAGGGQEGPRTVNRKFNFAGLFPENLSFYRYHGSLTTPTCDEQVLWIVHNHPVHISLAQVQQFEQVEDHEALKLQENFRHVQPRNGRPIDFYTVEFGPCHYNHNFRIYG